MKNFRTWKFPLGKYLVITIVSALAVFLFDSLCRWQFDYNREMLKFEQVLVGQKEIGNLSDPIVRQLAQDLIESQHSDNVAVVRKAEDGIINAIEKSNNSFKTKECAYVAEHGKEVRELARREPGAEKLVRSDLGLHPLFSVKKMLRIIALVITLPLLLVYGCKGILRLKDKRRLDRLTRKYGPRVAKAAEAKRYRAPNLEAEMSPESLRTAENARLIQTEPGEVQELIALQEALAPGNTARGQ